MPIYEYQCTNCGHQLEALQKFSDPALTSCPECSQESLKKLVSSTSFQLKGTGWYATDFKDKGKPKPADTTKETTKADDKPASDTAKSSGSTESKTE